MLLRKRFINILVIVVTKSAPDLLKPEWRLLVVVHVFAMNLWNAVFVLEFLSVILLFSFVFSQLLHFVSWVNENPLTCHAYDGKLFFIHPIMSSTNTANVIERVLNNKTIFNYLFVTNNTYKCPITNVSNECFGFEYDILERNWYKWFRNKLTLQKHHGPLFQVSHLWDISQFTFVSNKIIGISQ